MPDVRTTPTVARTADSAATFFIIEKLVRKPPSNRITASIKFAIKKAEE